MFPEPDLKFPSLKSNCTVLNKWSVISVTWSNNEENLNNCWSNGIKIITFSSGDAKGSDYSYIGDLGRLNGSYETYLSTFLYWDMVLRIEVLVLIFIRAHRERNFLLYCETLEALMFIFFAVDHYNYSR